MGQVPHPAGAAFSQYPMGLLLEALSPHLATAKTWHFSLREAGLCARAHMSFTVSVIHRVLQICLKGNICGDFAPGLRNPRGPLDVEG